ncbi:MAG: 5'/3'-nucleotidase SurE [Paludibacteraceae bacterium]|nr:5'/3'-nucleotidase SurE [Paludibacteraceae bacterium]
MNILITNDDGWGTKGIRTLTRLMLPLGRVYVIAPEGPRSGAAACISVNKPMYLTRVTDAGEGLEQAEIYTTNGTPADCIKLAINALFKGDERQIDLLVSGINHGSNASINVIYSGTMGACMVAAEHGIPAIGFSYCDHGMDPDLTEAEKYIPDITRHLMEEEVPYGICYNVNFPVGEVEGIQWTRQSKAHWEKELEPHVDEQGRTFYTLIGNFVNHEPEAEDTDEYALAHHRISITPTNIDTTAYALL